MQNDRIPDEQITTASAEDVVNQYSAWVQKIVNRYSGLVNETGTYDVEDMYQAGIVGLLEAQNRYEPAGGCSFLTYSYNHIRNAILSLFGYDNPQRKRPPIPLTYLDKPLTDDDDTTLIDTIEDPDIIPFDEPIIDQETRQETAAAVRAAIDRLRNPKQREVISRCWLNGQKRAEAAAEMGIDARTLYFNDRSGRNNLRHDPRLRKYAMPLFHVGAARFNTTWTSAVELAVIWRDEHLQPGYDRAAEIRRIWEEEHNRKA